MRRACWIFVLIALGLSTTAAAGDIQIFCEPGLRLFLDGESVGTSSARDDGLYLMNVPRGKHVIRVEKDGFVPQTFQVDVARAPVEIHVEDFAPAPAQPPEDEVVEEEVTLLAGRVVVTSAPQNCVVEIDGNPETKSTPQLSVGGLEAGEHTITFRKTGYEPITGQVTIRPGSSVVIRGNLIEGKIETVHQGKGSLRVTSKPIRCTIRFRGKVVEKNHTRLNRTHIPSGEYPITVSIRGRELSTKVLIMDQQRTELEVSFMKGDEPFVVSYVPER